MSQGELQWCGGAVPLCEFGSTQASRRLWCVLYDGCETESPAGVAEVEWWAALVGSTPHGVEVGLEAFGLAAVAYRTATLCGSQRNVSIC